MKSKAILFLLSLSILLSTPIFAAVDITSSSLLADPSEATMLKSTKSSVEIKNGETEDLANYVSLLVDETHAANSSELIWSIENNEGEFANSGSSYTALVDSGKATAVVSTDDGRLTLKIELTAVKKEVATGFKFEQSHYDIPNGTGVVADFYISIIPTPEGSKFTSAQMDKIRAKAYNDGFLNHCLLINADQLPPLPSWIERTPDWFSDDNCVRANVTQYNIYFHTGYRFGTGANLTNEKKHTLEIDDFPLSNGKTAKRKSQEVTLKFVDPTTPTSLGNGGTLKINVGEEFELIKWLKLLPTTSNNRNEDYTFSFEGYGDDYETDYIAYDKVTNKIRGVKTGKLKVTAANIQGLQTTFAIVVEPFKEDEKKDTPLVAPQRALAVGESFTVTFGSEVTEEQAKTATYGSLNEDIATVDSNGVVTAVKAGIAKIWVEVEGYAKGYYTVTVTDGASTDVPMTATIALAPLF